VRIPTKLAVTVLLGCTSPTPQPLDARVVDAHLHDSPLADAVERVDASIDAPVPIDAPPDTPVT